MRAGASDRVRVRWRAEDPEGRGKTCEKIQVVSRTCSKRVATIRTQGTDQPREVHDRSPRPGRNVHMRSPRAGDIHIEGIEGNKDVRMTAGDLFIDVQARFTAACARVGVDRRSEPRSPGDREGRLQEFSGLVRRRSNIRSTRGCSPATCDERVTLQKCSAFSRGLTPDDLKARTKKFAVDVIRFARTIPKDHINDEIASQLADAATSTPRTIVPCAGRSPARTSLTSLVVRWKRSMNRLYGWRFSARRRFAPAPTVPLWKEADELTRILVRSRETAGKGQGGKAAGRGSQVHKKPTKQR